MKKILLVAAMAVLAFTHEAGRGARNHHMSGGYTPVPLDTLLQKNDPTFEKALKTAKDAFEAKYNGSLGELKSVSEQIVAGVNYKL